MRGFRQFDAPVSVIGCIDRDLIDSTEAYFDLGQFVYAMVIAAWDRGVGAVINGQGFTSRQLFVKKVDSGRSTHCHYCCYGLPGR